MPPTRKPPSPRASAPSTCASPIRATPAAIDAEVRLVEALGTETVVHAATGSGDRILAVLPGQASLSPGTRIALAGAASDLHFFDAAGSRV